MSEFYQQNLQAIVDTLQTTGTDLFRILEAKEPSEATNTQLRVGCHQLKAAVARGQQQIDLWRHHIDCLEDPDQRKAEYDVLFNFPPAKAEPRAADDLTVMQRIERSHELIDWAEAYFAILREQSDGSEASVQAKDERTKTNQNEPHRDEDPKQETKQVHVQFQNQQMKPGPQEEPKGQDRRPFPKTQPNHQLFNARLPTYDLDDEEDWEAVPFGQHNQMPNNAASPRGRFGQNVPSASVFRPFRLEPVKFAGDPKEWNTFWLAFERAIDSQPIPLYEKHIGLLQSLVKDSPAYKAISGYPPSDKNYDLVLRILKEQFGDARALREGLIADLLHLPMASNSLSSVRFLRENVERICLQLEGPTSTTVFGGSSPGRETQDEIICGIIRSKLSRDTLETLLGWEQESGFHWSLDDLRNGLTRWVSLKDRVERTMTAYRPPKAESQDAKRQSPPDSRKSYDQPHSPPMETRAFACLEASTQPPGPDFGNGCSLCCEGPVHRPSQCPKYPTAKAKADRLMDQNRCVNCMRSGHYAKDCRDPKRCTDCGKKHHYLVCFKAEWRQQNSRIPSPNSNDNQSEGGQPRATGGNAEPLGNARPQFAPITSTFTGMVVDSPPIPSEPNNATDMIEVCATDVCPQPKAVLMAREVMAKSHADEGPKCKAMTFFDPGSHCNYISLSKAKELGMQANGTEELNIHVFGNPTKAPIQIKAPRFRGQLEREDGKWENVQLFGIKEIAAPMEIYQPMAGEESTIRPTLATPDILIGTRRFWRYFVNATPLDEELYQIQTVFGPVLGGEAQLEGWFHDARMVPQELVPTAPKIDNSLPRVKTAMVPLEFPSRVGSQPNLRTAHIAQNPVDQLIEPKPPDIPEVMPLDQPLLLELCPPSTEPIFPFPEKLAPPVADVEPPDKEMGSSSPSQPALRISAKVTFMAALLLCLLLTIVASTSPNPPFNCTECGLKCIQTGVTVEVPEEIHKTEVCCMGDCLVSSPKSHYTYELPQEILVNDYTCAGRFWHDSERVFAVSTQCPAVDECRLIDCRFCWDIVANPSCSPQWAMTLIGSGMACLLYLLGTVWSIFVRVRLGAGLLYRIFSYLFAWPLALFNRLTDRQIPNANPREMEPKLRMGMRAVKRNVTNARKKARNAAQELWSIRPKPLIPLIVLLCLYRTVPPVEPGSQTVAVVTHSESCIRGQTGLICTIQSASTLTLLPAGQSSSLLLKDEHGMALGQLTVTFQSLQMEYLQKSEAWLRSYHMRTMAIKRCPRAGSCRDTYCDQVKSDTMVPELKEANAWPGHSFCLDSSSFWHNQCGLPAAACLFYRYYAQTMSRRPYEVLSCPSWDVQIKVVFTLELSGGKTIQQELILHPGLTTTWGNVTITPLAFSIPPSPILGSKFLTDGRSVALVDHLPEALHCADEDSARRFNCTIAVDACKSCVPDHDKGLITCHCQDADLEGIMENPMARLPLTVARVRLLNQGPAIYAEHPYSPIQLHIQIKGLRLILEFRDSKCTIEPISLVGCYKCATGAQFRYRCQTDWGSALAKVECNDGTLFATQCSTNGTEKSIILPFDHSLVETVCTVDCPAGETNFNLSATLHYIPLKKQFGHQVRTSETLEAPDDQWDWPFDLGFDPFAVYRLWAKLPFFAVFAVALIFGLIALYLFVKFSPAYRAYRLMVQLLLHQNGVDGLARMAAVATVLPLVRAVSPFPEPSPLADGPAQPSFPADRLSQIAATVVAFSQLDFPIPLYAVFIGAFLMGLLFVALIVFCGWAFGTTVAYCCHWWQNRHRRTYQPRTNEMAMSRFSSRSTVFASTRECPSSSSTLERGMSPQFVDEQI